MATPAVNASPHRCPAGVVHLMPRVRPRRSGSLGWTFIVVPQRACISSVWPMSMRRCWHRSQRPPSPNASVQCSRTNVKSSGAAAAGRNCTRSVRASRACATITPLSVRAPPPVTLATNESPAIRPLPSQYTPEKVSRAPSPPISLDMALTDNPTNSSDGVTERHAPVNASGDDAVNVVSAGPAEQALVAHSITTITPRIRMLPPQ